MGRARERVPPERLQPRPCARTRAESRMIHHEEKGSGTAIVFVHAGIADARMWDPQWRSFAAGYRLPPSDLAGFGRTPLGELPSTHARDVASLLEVLDLRDVVLV